MSSFDPAAVFSAWLAGMAGFVTNSRALALWDWMFGSLYIPQKGERFRFGVAHD